MSKSWLVKAENINLSIEQKVILQDVSLCINEQDFITIIGPNGAGKTTLLNCLVGTHNIDSGKLQKQRYLHLGYVPQKLHLPSDIPITVEHFIHLQHRHATSTTKQHKQLSTQQILQLLGIESLLQQPMQKLSGGQLQLVMLARALLQQPNLLILDEPAKSLDINAQLRFYQLLEYVYEQLSLAILLVSHDLHFVMKQSQQIICLQHRICCSGKPKNIKHDPRFISLFGVYQSAGLGLFEHDLHSHLQHQQANSNGK